MQLAAGNARSPLIHLHFDWCRRWSMERPLRLCAHGPIFPAECRGKANALRPPSFLPVGEDKSSRSGKGRPRTARGNPATSTHTVASPESRRRRWGAALACFPARTALDFSSHISEFHKGVRLSGFTADQRIGIPEPAEQREHKGSRPIAPVRPREFGTTHDVPTPCSPCAARCFAVSAVHTSAQPVQRKGV